MAHSETMKLIQARIEIIEIDLNCISEIVYW